MINNPLNILFKYNYGYQYHYNSRAYWINTYAFLKLFPIK